MGDSPTGPAMCFLLSSRWEGNASGSKRRWKRKTRRAAVQVVTPGKPQLPGNRQGARSQPKTPPELPNEQGCFSPFEAIHWIDNRKKQNKQTNQKKNKNKTKLYQAPARTEGEIDNSFVLFFPCTLTFLHVTAHL